MTLQLLRKESGKGHVVRAPEVLDQRDRRRRNPLAGSRQCNRPHGTGRQAAEAVVQLRQDGHGDVPAVDCIGLRDGPATVRMIGGDDDPSAIAGGAASSDVPALGRRHRVAEEDQLVTLSLLTVDVHYSCTSPAAMCKHQSAHPRVH